jgi:hypothetical protein
MIVLFDMDDVTVEWRGEAIKLAGGDAESAFDHWIAGSTAHQLGLSDAALWDIIRSTPDWWANLPKTAWFDELADYVESLGLDWYFCTSPPRPKADNRAVSQKMNWADKHGYDSQKKVIIAHDKWLLAGPDRILIDDKDSNCVDFRRKGGNAIIMPQPWNSKSHLTDIRISYVKECLETYFYQHKCLLACEEH